MSRNPFKKFKHFHKTRHWKKNKIAYLLMVGLIGGSFATIGFFELYKNNPTQTIEIRTSSEDQMEIAFWASLNPNTYTLEQLESLNNHSTLLIGGVQSFVTNDTYVQYPDQPEMWINTSKYNSSNQSFVSQCQDWLTNYPNVRIMPTIAGIPGQSVQDHCAIGTTWLAETILNATIENNLTNVVGINTDQEEFGNPEKWGFEEEDLVPDIERNENATRIWNEWFERCDTLYPPGRFIYQTTFGVPSTRDMLDNDRDLDVLRTDNVFSVPGWDEYAPMLYAAGGENYEPGVHDAGKDHFSLYQDMAVLEKVLEMSGQSGKIGAFIGITGCEVFYMGNEIQLLGEPITAYDALVQQGLIVKSFGAKRLTIFLLWTVEVKHDDGSWDHNMTGVFDEYGDDFLDRYNESVNGPASDQPFHIPLLYEDGVPGQMLQDSILNPGVIEGLIVSFFFAGGLPFLLDKSTVKKINTLLKKKPER
ncbi:MAG: hypothetical protein ACFFCS_14220 [Candidatus Hodarchaeota archaeon]